MSIALYIFKNSVLHLVLIIPPSRGPEEVARLTEGNKLGEVMQCGNGGAGPVQGLAP